MAIVAEMPATESVAAEVIRLRNLLFRWQPEMPPTLDVQELSIKRGERVFISGASGSGKSTLLSLLAGVLMPQSGEVHLLGHPLHRLGSARRDHLRADHVGFIFQLFNLIPYLSVLENVTLPCQFSRLRRERVLKTGHSLETEARRLLQHLELSGRELLSRPVTMLSVGQQQRVAAARALMGAPDLLIADEPTSSLDTELRQAFIRSLFREGADQGTTLVFVSHDPSLQGLFDRVVSLETINRAEGSLASKKNG
jgi:putative ABC transport system ATP-binding protein